MKTVATTKAKGPFVNSLRAGRGTIDLSRPNEPAMTVRVEMAEVWDTIRVTASPSEPVVSVKRAALEAMGVDAPMPEEFVMKLRGWEILDEGASLTDVEALDGSTFLLTYRRRRAVK